jgi:hypothetical protein
MFVFQVFRDAVRSRREDVAARSTDEERSTTMISERTGNDLQVEGTKTGVPLGRREMGPLHGVTTISS